MCNQDKQKTGLDVSSSFFLLFLPNNIGRFISRSLDFSKSKFTVCFVLANTCKICANSCKKSQKLSLHLAMQVNWRCNKVTDAMLKRTKKFRIMKQTKISLSCWFWKENIRECFNCKLHLLRRGQLHQCDQKIAFLFLDLISGKELVFFSVSL